MKLNEFKRTVKESGQFNISNKASEIDVTNYLKEAPIKSYPSFRKLAYATFSVLFLGVLGLFGYLNLNPVTTLTIDINPSIEVELNIFNRVIDIQSNNTEGTAFIEALSYKNKTVDFVMNEIYEVGLEQAYFTESEAYMLIGVYSNDLEKEEKINLLLDGNSDITVVSLLEHDYINYEVNDLRSNIDASIAEGSNDYDTEESVDSPNYNTDGQIDDSITDISIYNDVDQLANDYNVSVTKVLLVLEIIDSYPAYNYVQTFSILINSDISYLITLYNQK